MNSERIGQLLEESNALKREIVEATRRNLELARGINERAAELQTRARRVLALLLPLIVVLIGYVSWLLFFRLRV